MSGDVVLVVLSILLATLAFVLVGARCVARFAIRKEKGAEDGFVILALVCSVALAALFVGGEEANCPTIAQLTRL